MKMTIYLLNIAILFGILASCTKEPFSERDFPRLQTYSVSDVSPKGATFNARFIVRGNATIVEYGFVWSPVTTDDPTVSDLSDRVTFKGDITDSDFSANIEANLGKEVEYKVRAYIITSDHLVYGNKMVFKSLGSEQVPVIESFRPRKAFAGDTLFISGRNFTFNRNNIQVYIGNREAFVMQSSDTLTMARVPANANADSLDLKVSVLGSVSVAPFKFHYLRP